MHPSTSPAPHPRPDRRRHRPLRAVTPALVAVLLAGCGLRLETPPPAEPSPDAVEQVRARAVDDALALADAAGALLAQGPGEDVQVVLDDVVAFSGRHAEELGGVYDSGLPAPDATPTPSPTPVTTDVAGLLAALVDDGARAAADADEVADGPLARLVAAVGTSRDGLAARLAQAADLPLPEPSAAPDPGTDADTDDAAPGATDPADAPGAGSSTDASPTADVTTAAAPDRAVADAAAAVALAHDEAAWTATVLAARTSDERRAALLASAAAHRAASDAWAQRAGVVDTPRDPRRAAYALPVGVDDPAVADQLERTLEQSVAAACADAVALLPAGDRAPAVACLRAATADATLRGAGPVPFPGLVELASVPVG